MIAAAGSGERLGAGGAKAFALVNHAPLLVWSLQALAEAQAVEAIVVAAPPDGVERAEEIAAEMAISARVVAGADTRAASVAAALDGVESEVVAIHDAARPMVTARLVDQILEDLGDHPEADAVIAAARVTDTIKEAGDDRIASRTLDRDRLWAAQTPQAFRTAKLREVIGDTGATDEAMLIEAAGGVVRLHEVLMPNIKVTTPADMMIAEELLKT